MSTLIRNWFSHFMVASAIALVALPYVWLTNLTATRPAIVGHAILMWLAVPPLMAVTQTLLDRLNLSVRLQLLWGALAYFVSLCLGAAVMIVLFHAVTGAPYEDLVVPPLFSSLLPVFTLYMIFLFSRFWRKQQERELQITAEKDHAAFQALSAQLKPHFFFNSLNTLEHLVDANPTDAKLCIRQLAGLYRKILENSSRTLVPIAEEISLATDYLKIQKYRFTERLHVEWDVQAGIEGKSLPPNMLLNLVENAIKHGVEMETNNTPIRITISGHQHGLEVTVENHASRVPAQGTGFGTKDIEQRLKLIYGDGAKFHFTIAGDRARAQLSINKDLRS